ncbi:MAG TPA: hypothetical protein VF384_19770 [Planctomycetota bacterium]
MTARPPLPARTRRRRPWRAYLATMRGRRAAGSFAVLLLASLWWLCRDGEQRNWSQRDVLEAIRFVESSHRDDVPDGDGGKAIGPFQIHHVFWQDAVMSEPALGGTYSDCRRRDYAERVVAAYMRRWIPDAWAAGEAETIARVHNGGPTGPQNPATRGYWRKVRARLP